MTLAQRRTQCPESRRGRRRDRRLADVNCESHEVSGQELPGTALASPFDDSSRNGPALHGVVLRGELAEWSCDAVGWLAEVVADSAARLGVRTPLLFTVGKSASRP